MKNPKFVEKSKVREYLLTYNRSNLPSDRTIGEMFNIGQTSVYNIRQELIKDGLINDPKRGRFGI